MISNFQYINIIHIYLIPLFVMCCIMDNVGMQWIYYTEILYTYIHINNKNN